MIKSVKSHLGFKSHQHGHRLPSLPFPSPHPAFVWLRGTQLRTAANRDSLHRDEKKQRTGAGQGQEQGLLQGKETKGKISTLLTLTRRIFFFIFDFSIARISNA